MSMIDPRQVAPSQAAALSGHDVAAAFAAAADALSSLPDQQELTRLANALYSALPASSPAEGVTSQVAATAPAPVTSLGEVPPSSGPVADGTAAPRPSFGGAPLPGTPPGMTPFASEAELHGLPELPAIRQGSLLPDTPRLSPTGSSFYFLDDLRPPSPPRGLTPGTGSPTFPGGSESAAHPPADMKTVLPVDTPGFGPTGPSFYFLDDLRAPSWPGQTPGTHSLGAAPTIESAGHPAFDVNALRRDFPILNEHVNGRPLIWLDNAATTQKPQVVIDRLAYFYRHENSNIHRAAHELAARATDAYEAAREKVRRFLAASSSDEIVFVRGATEAINLVAQSWGRQNIGRGDEIVITWLEHHANIVPWQQLCLETGARLRVAPVDDEGQVLLDAYGRLLGPRTRLVAFSHVSNALGTVTPAHQMVEMARRYGAHVLIDGAQAVSHMRVDVQSLDCDWYVLSGHKVFAPTGIGALYGKKQVLDAMPPWQGGGNMIACVTFEKTEYQASPARFEAGTGSIGDAAGLGAAIDYLERVGIANVTRYEQELLGYATRLLSSIPGLRLIGTAPEKAAVLSFVLEGIRSEDVGAALNREGIAVRAGHHCAQPILQQFGVESTVRPSLAFYNTYADIDVLIEALQRIRSGSPLVP